MKCLQTIDLIRQCLDIIEYSSFGGNHEKNQTLHQVQNFSSSFGQKKSDNKISKQTFYVWPKRNKISNFFGVSYNIIYVVISTPLSMGVKGQ